MKKIVNVKTDAVEIRTKIGDDYRRITIVDGEIARIVCEAFNGSIIYHVRADSDLEFDDVAQNGHGNVTIFMKYDCCKCGRMHETKFDELCKSEIRLVTEHNLKELKKLYKALKDERMKEYCKKRRDEILELLDF